MGGGGCPEPIFLESIHLNLDFGGFYSVVAPKLAALEFFENRAWGRNGDFYRDSY